VLHVQTLEDLRPLMKVGIPGLGLAGVFFISKFWKNGILKIRMVFGL